jgi:hypothetical protein
VIGAERHGLFLIDVLARLNRRHEVQRVLMLRRGDQDRVDVLIVEQLPKVLVGLDRRNERLHLIQPAGVNVRGGDSLGIGASHGGLEDLLPAAAVSDDAEPHPIVGAQHATGREAGHGDSHCAAGALLDEGAAVRHRSSPPGGRTWTPVESY